MSIRFRTEGAGVPQELEIRYQRETLVATLREHGVAYLAPSDAVATEVIPSTGALINAILQQSDARLKLALIPLFIRHPEFALDLPTLIAELDPSLALELQTYYMASVYLQRHWKSRLGLYLDNKILLPDLYSQRLGLPAADESFGKTGLHELADRWKARSRYPFNRLASLHQTIDLFFEQLRIERTLAGNASTG